MTTLAETPATAARWRARLAVTEGDVAAAQVLRHLCFVAGPGLPSRPGGRDADRFDATCRHLLVELAAGGAPVACCRIMVLPDGRALPESYAAQFYALGPLADWPDPLVEVGRFCIRPGLRDPDVLRVAWAALTQIVDAAGAGMMFGCSSFAGTDPAEHRAALALLSARHQGPAALRPGIRAAEVVALSDLATGPLDAREGMRRMPPLLRTYLAMGGWVGDHAVVDRDLGTLHVFTAVEVGRVPPARAARLRALAQDGRPLAVPEQTD